MFSICSVQGKEKDNQKPKSIANQGGFKATCSTEASSITSTFEVFLRLTKFCFPS